MLFSTGEALTLRADHVGEKLGCTMGTVEAEHPTAAGVDVGVYSLRTTASFDWFVLITEAP